MKLVRHQGSLPEPIKILGSYLEKAGTSIIDAAFRYSFFVDPEEARKRTPYFPDRARMSREHYPKGVRGETRQWKGVDVRLGDNARAQIAWAKYTGTPIARGSGYGVRHIWGCPWDPFAFTAGWNLCYMPFWLGMLTEDQHPHPKLVRVIQQASFDLYFRVGPVCEKPAYVVDHGIDLKRLLGDNSIQLLVGGRSAARTRTTTRRVVVVGGGEDSRRRLIAIRNAANASWSNILKGVAALQELPHEPFATGKVANTSKSVVRRMQRETGLSIRELDMAIRELARGG